MTDTCPTCGGTVQRWQLLTESDWHDLPRPLMRNNRGCPDAWHLAPCTPSDPAPSVDTSAPVLTSDDAPTISQVSAGVSVDTSKDAVREALALVEQTWGNPRTFDAKATITAALATLQRENADLRAEAGKVARLEAERNWLAAHCRTNCEGAAMDAPAWLKYAALATLDLLAPQPTTDEG